MGENGCSLEDCYTNLFALTDLAGIRWCRLHLPPNSYYADPLEDPVLLSFSKCIQADMLCAWRRQPSVAGVRLAEQMAGPKELWTFWYGEEPATLQDIKASAVFEAEQGCWENGLTYECRTLLFKSLHNLIERCLLSQNYVRIGKWFVQPHRDASEQSSRSSRLSISFAFFLHGESTVCASIDVRQHPPLHSLRHTHLSVASHMLQSGGIHVLLAPYGLSGVLTGRAYSDSDPKTQKLLEDWRRYFYVPAPADNTTEDGTHVPLFAEVVVAGTRFRYPSSFVLVPGEEDAQLTRIHASLFQHQAADVDTGMSARTTNAVDNALSKLASAVRLDCGFGDKRTAQRAIDKTWQDGMVSSGLFMHGGRHLMNESEGRDEPSATAPSTWDFGEPMQKNPCFCGKSKGVRGRPPSGVAGKQGQVQVSGSGKYGKSPGERPEKMSRHARGYAPYHRRLTFAAREAAPAASASCMDVASLNGLKSVSLHGSASSGQTHGATTAADSPHSAAPSPLTATQAQQPPGNPVADPPMPTLSPHPPLKHENRDTLSSLLTSGNQSDAENASVAATGGRLSSSANAGEHKFGGGILVADGGVEQRLPQLRCLRNEPKKPVLTPMFDGENDEELVTTSFYDYSPDSVLEVTSMSRCHRLSADQSPPYVSSPPLQSSLGPTAMQTDPAKDPYLFDDAEPGVIGTSLKMREMRSGSRDGKPFATGRTDERREISCNGLGDVATSMDVSQSQGAKASQSLRNENDLKPTPHDLENIFDTDEEIEAGDSPPSSVPHEPQGDETTGVTSGRSATSSAVTGVRHTSQGPSARDLSRMFPTPPSAEMPCSSISSPMQAAETVTAEAVAVDTLHPHHFTSSTSALTSGRDDGAGTVGSLVLRKSCLPVVDVPQRGSYTSSLMYDPVELPSGKLPSLPVADRSYRQMRGNLVPIMMNPMARLASMLITHYNTYMEGSMGQSGGRFRRNESMSMDASPAAHHVGGPNSVQQRTPINYELMSPASSSGASSSFYAGRNIGSVDGQCQSMSSGPLPEAGALYVGLALADSPLGIFRDVNFDSCTMCVCNLNIHGSDVGSVLPVRTGSASMDDAIRCTCAFSAVINRRHARLAGLFYEDEVEITGIRHTAYDQMRLPPLCPVASVDGRNPTLGMDMLSDDVVQLLRLQLSTLYPSCTANQVCMARRDPAHTVTDVYHVMDMFDAREACAAALECSQQLDTACSQPPRPENATSLHRWPFLKYEAKIATNSTDVIQLLKTLQELLQNAIQKKRPTRLWESVYTISGPLTWKDFHLLAGRGSEETSEPKPVPSLLVGYEQEWLSISPHAIRYWERMLMEPCHRPHDVLYIVVAPENDYVLCQASAFFQQLSVTYEQCRLGRHRPLSDKLRDSIMRVGRFNAQKVADEPLDDWFHNIGNSPVAAKLRIYAQVCRKLLAPFLVHCLSEKRKQPDENSRAVYQPYRHLQNSLESNGSDGPASVEMSSLLEDRDVPDGRVNDAGSFDHDRDHIDSASSTADGSVGGDGPFVVVYMVDSFTYGTQAGDGDDVAVPRLANVGLLRCYSGMLKAIPDNLHSSIQLQIVPQQTITDFIPFGSRSQFFKNLSFSVYSGCRRSLTLSLPGRSLTGFGPASSAEKVWSAGVSDSGRSTVSYSSPFVLAPPRSICASLLDPVDRSGVLLCTYCLSADQRWLFASCTNSRGELLETTCINIDVPFRSQRRVIAVRRSALQKLWDFLVGVMSQTTTPWRIVIGRFGRLGHGELKGWSAILSRRSLRSCNEKLRAACMTCRQLSDTAVPCVVSACVISTELHPSIHIMIDAVKPDDNQRARRQISTPTDSSCTHILVFPTSATAQANLPMNLQETHNDPEFGGVGELKLFGDTDPIDDDLGGDLFGELFGAGVHHTDIAGSPVHHSDNDRQSMGLGGGPGRDSTASDLLEDEDLSNHSLLQQPLAVGFYVSSAPTGPLPAWFWSSCPQRENLCPVCFRAALHIHCPFAQQKEELMHNSTHSSRVHPLDSNLTCDVLRYVLETYNSLSWLTVDATTGDRRSCLPAHILVLMQLYRGFEALI